MTAVTAAEVVGGLVVHLDTALLRSAGGSQTNAEKTASEDRAVVGPHYFLILGVDPNAQVALAVPLFSKWAPGSRQLDEGKKDGLADKWIGEDSRYSQWQHWRIPVGAIVAASAGDEATAANRRSYAASSPEELKTIGAWASKNRNAFRNV